MKRILVYIALVTLAAAGHIVQAQSYAKGSQLVLLSNLHPDISKKYLYTMNYQLPNLIPMCSEITVVSRSKKKFTFSWKGQQYTMAYDKHTKKAGITFDTVLGYYLGEECDSDKVEALSELDKKGIRKGIPYVGMTRQAVIYAMGRPPIHANPDLDQLTWMYWLNRFKRQAIDFDDQGLVEEIRL